MCYVVSFNCHLFQLFCSTNDGLDMLHGGLDILYLFHLLLVKDLTETVYNLQTLLFAPLLVVELDRRSLDEDLKTAACKLRLY